MYWRDVWRFSGSNEYEYKYPGRYGARGERRAKKKRNTPEQIKKQNQINRENRVRRIIKANFTEGDIWCCLKYLEGTRKGIEEVKKDLKRFLDKLRRAYKKCEEELKFIYRIEIGKKGGIHVHILVNRSRKMDTDLMTQRAWENGRVNFQSIYEAGGYTKLANYIVKMPTEEDQQLSLFPEEERKELIKYSTSRNLIRPEPERKHYTRRTVRKLVEEGPKPTPGYYIDKNSIVSGINPFTGHTYYRYTEVRIREERCEMIWKEMEVEEDAGG